MVSNGGLGSIVVGGINYDTSQQNTGICKKNCRDRLSDISTFKGSRYTTIGTEIIGISYVDEVVWLTPKLI